MRRRWAKKTVYNLLVRCNTEYLRWSSFEKQDLTPGERATIQKNLDAAGMTELYPFWNVVQACRAGDFNRLIKSLPAEFPEDGQTSGFLLLFHVPRQHEEGRCASPAKKGL